MTPGHALMGAASGYFTCAAIEIAGNFEFSWWFPHIAAGITAGWAMWCDIDSQKAAVSTSLGFITRGLHELICWIAAGIYYATRTDKDAPQPKIHRGITHTWPGALFMGVLMLTLCLIYPTIAVPILLSISLHWGLRGLAIPKDAHGTPRGNAAGRFLTKRAYTFLRMIPMPGRIFRWLIKRGAKLLGFSKPWMRTCSLGICLLAAFAMCHDLPELGHEGYIVLLAWLVTQGCLVHMLGDSLTESGICWRFPFVNPKTGKRWQETKIPTITIRGKVFKPAFKTGRAFEIGVVYPVMILTCVACAPGGWALLVELSQHGPAWRQSAYLGAALPFAHGRPGQGQRNPHGRHRAPRRRQRSQSAAGPNQTPRPHLTRGGTSSRTRPVHRGPGRRQHLRRRAHLDRLVRGRHDGLR
jgi:membrane-bound metal-dependent hydrolase YbcI (DUF457 family)